MPIQTRRSLLRSAAALAAAPLAGFPATVTALEMTPIGSETPVPLPAPEFLRAGDWLEVIISKQGVNSKLLDGSFLVEVIEADPESNRLVLSDNIPIDTIDVKVIPRSKIQGLTADRFQV